MARNLRNRGNLAAVPDTRQRQVLPASSLIKNRVINREGEDLGTIKELMIDVDTGRIAYAVLSFGGVLGLGDKLFAIPWSSLNLDQGAQVFTLDASKEMLRHAPGFDKDDWPDMSAAGFGVDIYSFYGATRYWE